MVNFGSLIGQFSAFSLNSGKLNAARSVLVEQPLSGMHCVWIRSIQCEMMPKVLDEKINSYLFDVDHAGWVKPCQRPTRPAPISLDALDWAFGAGHAALACLIMKQFNVSRNS